MSILGDRSVHRHLPRWRRGAGVPHNSCMRAGIDDHGIVARKAAVRWKGRRSVERALLSGDLLPVDRTRVALRGTPPPILAAARARGTLTCLSALKLHDVWTLDDARIHLNRSRGVRDTHCLPADASDCRGRVVGGESVLEPVDVALSAVLASHDREHGIVALDSIIRQGLLTADQLERLTARHGAAAMRLLARADGRVESPLESVLRHRLLMLGVRVRTQVLIPGLGRVDMLVGESLIIEADGFEFHSGRDSFRDDRRRDREALRRGFQSIRITWADVFNDWNAVLPVLLEIVRSRRHRRRPVLGHGDLERSRRI